MSVLGFLFPFGRGRPSVRDLLGDSEGKLMSIEASVARIEAQNATIAEVLVGVFATQKTHTEMLKSLAAAAPQAIDTTELDASIADTDAKLATLTQPAASTAKQAGAQIGTAGDPTASQDTPQPDAPAAGAASAA